MITVELLYSSALNFFLFIHLAASADENICVVWIIPAVTKLHCSDLEHFHYVYFVSGAIELVPDLVLSLSSSSLPG